MITKRFDPFALVESNLFNDLSRLFEAPGIVVDKWTPRVDIADMDEAVVVRAELPGIDPDSIDITVEENILTISGSRRFESSTEDEATDTAPRYQRREIVQGSFMRKIRLASEVDFDAVTATSSDGILEVTLPKQPTSLPRKVTVDVQR